MIPSALQAYRWKAPIRGDSMSPRFAARAGVLTLALFAFVGADLPAQAGADQVARASSRIPSTPLAIQKSTTGSSACQTAGLSKFRSGWCE